MTVNRYTNIDKATGIATLDKQYSDDGTAKQVVPVDEATLDAQLSGLRPYSKWHPSIDALHKSNPEMKYGKGGANDDQNTPTFQLINFLAWHPNNAYSRADLIRIQDKLVPDVSRHSQDIIQCVNKIDQKGLMQFPFRLNGTKYYALPVIRVDYKRVATRQIVKRASDNKAIETQRQRYLDYANGDFQAGHIDPAKPLTPENTVYQPAEINKTIKDKYVCDPVTGLPHHISADYLKDHWNDYYSSREMVMLLHSLIEAILPETTQIAQNNE